MMHKPTSSSVEILKYKLVNRNACHTDPTYYLSDHKYLFNVLNHTIFLIFLYIYEPEHITIGGHFF